MNDRAAGKPRGWLLLTLLLLGVATVYAPVLGAPFVWDDSRLVLDSPQLRALSLSRAFLAPFWFGAPGEPGSSAFFRPITSLSFGIDYRLHGENPGGYHLTNLLLHLIATGLFFALLRRRRLAVAPAVLLAGLWSLLPRLSEGVGWISGRGDVLAGVFALGALLVYRPRAPARLALASGLALLAAFSKESGLGAFAALGVLVWLDDAKEHRLARLASVAACLLVYLGLRFHAGASAGDALPLAAGLRALGVLEALGRYGVMLLDLLRPRTFMGRLGAPAYGFVALGAALLVALLLLAPRLRRAGAATLACLALGALPLFFVLHVFRLPVVVVASDRYLYLPSAGLLLAAAPALGGWLARRRAALALLLGLVVACGVRTAQRVGDYSEVALFWLAAAQGSPREAVPLVELGSEAYRAGCFVEARAYYQRALELHDYSSPRPLENSALLASLMGERSRAATLSEELLRRFPGVPAFELRRATIALAALDFETARRHAERAATLDPKFARAKAFLRLLHEAHAAWPAIASGRAPAEERLELEMRALRYPEAVRALRGLLENPGSTEQALNAGLKFVIRAGTPEDARELLGLYLAHHTPPDAARLTEAVALRVETAAALRRRLAELPP